MFLSLDIQTPTGGSYDVAVSADEIEIGRSATCAVRLPYPAVSSRHLRLFRRDGQWTVVDLGSKNGTLIDGRTVAAGEEVTVTAGTAIQIGAVRLTARLTDGGGEGFTLTETGTMLRKMLAEAVGPSGASLQSDDGEHVAVPDFATDLRASDPAEFRVDRRGHGFWVTPLAGSGIKLDGVVLGPEGSEVHNGQRLDGVGGWVFHDPLEAHVTALETATPHGEPPEENVRTGRGTFETVVLAVGGVAILLATLILMVIFEVI